MSFWKSNKVSHDVMDDLDLQVSSQELSSSSKYPNLGKKVLDTLLIGLETSNLACMIRVTYTNEL